MTETPLDSSTAVTNQPAEIDDRPFRTLGLSLAIIAVFFLLGFVPLVPVIFIGVLALEGHPTTPSDGEYWLGPVFAVALIITCVLAWIGRPRRAGLYFQVATVFATLVAVYDALHGAAIISFNTGIGGGNLDNFFRTAANCLLPIRLIVLAYTIWYVNRTPARVFYDRK
jgi:hypothetical protein